MWGAIVGDIVGSRYEFANIHEKDFPLFSTYNRFTDGTVPIAMECFLESESFEDALRNAVSAGGDSDTIAAMAGGVAEAFYGTDEACVGLSRRYLDEPLLSVIERFTQKYHEKK